MTEKIDVERTLELLEEAVAEKPEGYKYEQGDPTRGCVYGNPNGTPSCIVGVVASKVSEELFKDLQDSESYVRDCGTRVYGVSYTVDDQENTFLEYFTVAATELLTAVQSLQDNRKTWRDAVDTVRGRFGI